MSLEDRQERVLMNVDECETKAQRRKMVHLFYVEHDSSGRQLFHVEQKVYCFESAG